MINEINKLFENRDFFKLKELLNDLNSADLAEIFEQLNQEKITVIFRLLTKDNAADLFSYLEPEIQEKLVEILNDRELKQLIQEMETDDAVDFIQEMPSNLVTKVLSQTTSEKRRQINELLNYKEDSAGSIMTVDFLEAFSSMTVLDVIKNIRKQKSSKDSFYTIYVVDASRKLLGFIDLKDLLMSEPETLLSQIYEDQYVSVTTGQDKEEVAKLFDKYDLIVMPVVDSEDRLVGVITIDDAMEVMVDESEEDFEIMAGIKPDEEEYLKQSIFKQYRNRIIWLIVLMFSATLTGTIISQYENSFQAVPILVSFIPMIMGTGGNSGAQTSTIIVRGLSTGELKTKDFYKALFKEICIAMLCGLTLGIANGIRIFLQYRDILLSLTIVLTLVATTIIAKATGCVLPILAKKLGFDPAYMASPLITTIVDCGALIIFFNIAVYIMGI